MRGDQTLRQESRKAMNWHLFFVIVSWASSVLFAWLAGQFRKCARKPGQDEYTAHGATTCMFASLVISFLSLTALVCLLIP